MVNFVFRTFAFLTSTTSTGSEEGSNNNGSVDRLVETLKKMVSSPAFYIVIGILVLLIILAYIFKIF